jgi:hypothetical protein
MGEWRRKIDGAPAPALILTQSTVYAKFYKEDIMKCFKIIE